jgi:outer membrane biosynthesis protein TonB
MNGVATITAHDGGRADAGPGHRFRQSQTTRERTAEFGDVFRQHRHAVLSACAERLWPDADAAIAAAVGVLVAARLAMADPARRPRPDLVRGWLLAIAAQACPAPGQPAGIGYVDWEAVRARVAVGPQDLRDETARVASLRKWLERIVATLPEPRQRMYDLSVTRGLDSRNAALELGTTEAEVRRLRRENRQAILRAFEVTGLAAAEASAAEAAVDAPGVGAPGCVELPQLLADARSDAGDPQEDGRRHTAVLSAAVRLALSRHLSECRPCQDRRDDLMARWAPEMLSILADAELREQVMEDLQSMPRLRQPGPVPGAHRRAAPAGPATKVVIGRAVVAAGTGLVAVLLLLAFAWPGLLRGTRAATDVSSADRNNSVTSGLDAPTVAGTVDGVPADKHGRPARPGAAGLLSTLPPVATVSPAGSVQPSVYYTTPPSTAPTSSPTQPTSKPSSSPSSSPSRTASPSPSASTSKPSPSPSASTGTPTPTPSASASTPTPTPTPSASTSTPTPTASASTPTPTPSASATDTAQPSPTASASASASPTASSTAAPSASATA